jgi:hypothetical protein
MVKLRRKLCSSMNIAFYNSQGEAPESNVRRWPNEYYFRRPAPFSGRGICLMETDMRCVVILSSLFPNIAFALSRSCCSLLVRSPASGGASSCTSVSSRSRGRTLRSASAHSVSFAKRGRRTPKVRFCRLT